MLTFPHVEDYLEYLAGYEVSLSALLQPQNTNRISLARYDIQIVNSMANNTMFGTALTDRQGELAVKLILKYRRQFSKQGVDVSPIENPVFRIPLRKMDRTKSIWIEQDKIKVKFPYDKDLISQMQEFKGLSQGSAIYNNSSKLWTLGLTEYNINWIVTFGTANQFEIAAGVQELFDKIITCESQPFEIKLVQQGDVYTITNAATSLIEFINQHGGFGRENLVRLIDYSGLCGYDAVELARNSHKSLAVIGVNHETYLEPSEDNLQMIFDYAELTNRYPICIYNPTLIDIDLSRFQESDIVKFDRNGKTNSSDYDPYGVKVVYAKKIPATWDFSVPLLISTFQMMFGGRKMDWTQRAEKIIYYTDAKIKDKN